MSPNLKAYATTTGGYLVVGAFVGALISAFAVLQTVFTS